MLEVTLDELMKEPKPPLINNNTVKKATFGGFVSGLGASAFYYASAATPAVGLQIAAEVSSTALAISGPVAATTPFALAPILPIAFPVVALSTAGFLAGVAGNRAYHHYKNSIKDKEALETRIVENLDSLFILNVEDYAPFRLSLKKLSSENIELLGRGLRKVKKKHPSSNIEGFKIDLKNLSQEVFTKLLETKIGNFGSAELVLQNADLINDMAYKLRNYVDKGNFRNLQSLSIKNCNLAANELQHILSIVKKNNLSKLDLSRNPLSNMAFQGTKEFLLKLEVYGPNLRTLKLKDTKLVDSDLESLKRYVGSPTLLENLDISGNGFSLKQLRRFVESDEFQSNLSLININTGYNTDEKIKTALDNRTKNIASLIKKTTIKDEKLEVIYEHQRVNKDPLSDDVILTFKILTHVQGLKGKNKNKEDALVSFLNKSITSMALRKQMLEKWKKYADLFPNKIIQGTTRLKEWAALKKKTFDVRTDPTVTLIVSCDVRGLARHKKIDIDGEEKPEWRDESKWLDKLIHDLDTQLNKANTNMTICRLKSLDLDDNKFQQLIDHGLLDFKIKELDLSDNALTDKTLQFLADLPEGKLAQLHTLKLSANKLTLKGLRHLEKLGQRLSIEILDLSCNLLTPQNQSQNERRLFESFWANMHQTMPTLQELNVTNIGLDEAHLPCIAPVLGTLSMLETVHLQQHSVTNSSPFSRLLKTSGFATNVNLSHVTTGFDSAGPIKAVVKEKERRCEQLFRTIRLRGPKVCQLLTHMMKHEGSLEVGQEAKTWLGHSHAKQSYLTQLELASQHLMAQKAPERIKSTHLVDIKRNPRSAFESILDNNIEALKLTENEQKYELTINGEQHNTAQNTQLFMTKTQDALAWLDENQKSPVISKLTLSNLNVTAAEFENLILAGLGHYRTKTLELSHMSITDEHLAFLASLDGDTFKHLDSLILNNNLITMHGLASLSEFAGQRGIQTIHLDNNPLQERTDTQDVSLLERFCESVSLKMPNLKSLSLTHVGLTDQTIQSLKPLLSKRSLLTEVNLEQKTVKSNKHYQSLLADNAVAKNFTLKQVHTGKGTIRAIKTLNHARSHTIASLQHSMTQREKSEPILLTLLNKLLVQPDYVWPQATLDVLNQKSVDQNDLAPNYRSQLEILLDEFKFYRAKASVMLDEFDERQPITQSEYQALMLRKLDEFWQLGAMSQQQKQAVEHRYSQVRPYLPNSKAREIVDFEINHVRIKLAWGEDGYFRLMNDADRKVYVLNPYIVALKLGNHERYVLELMTGMRLGFDHNAVTYFAMPGQEYIVERGVNQTPSHRLHDFEDLVLDHYTHVNTYRELSAPPVRVVNHAQQMHQNQSSQRLDPLNTQPHSGGLEQRRPQ